MQAAFTAAYLVTGNDFCMESWICCNWMVTIQVAMFAVNLDPGSSRLLDLLYCPALMTKHQALHQEPASDKMNTSRAQSCTPQSRICCSSSCKQDEKRTTKLNPSLALAARYCRLVYGGRGKYNLKWSFFTAAAASELRPWMDSPRKPQERNKGKAKSLEATQSRKSHQLPELAFEVCLLNHTVGQ